MGSRQYESEWRIYYDLVKSADVENRTLWLDMRGNHGTNSLITVVLITFLIYFFFNS